MKLYSNFLSKYIALSLAIVLMVILYYLCIYFHIFSSYNDHMMSDEIYTNLSKSGKYIMLNNKKDYVCFFSPYTTSDSLDIAIDKSKKKFLDNRINYYIGRSDSFWWIVIIGNDVKNPKMLKITGKTRPDFKGSKCSNSKSLILSATENKSSGYLFFNLEEF